MQQITVQATHRDTLLRIISLAFPLARSDVYAAKCAINRPRNYLRLNHYAFLLIYCPDALMRVSGVLSGPWRALGSTVRTFRHETDGEEIDVSRSVFGRRNGGNEETGLEYWKRRRV